MLVPQAVPFWTSVALAHVDAPVVQEVVPVWHRLPDGLQLAPDVHAVHVPLAQTIPAPQGVPLGAFVPWSVHVRPPSLQLDVPRWHGFAGGAHDPPVVHAAQRPEEQ
jgi:hypothetical protein